MWKSLAFFYSVVACVGNDVSFLFFVFLYGLLGPATVTEAGRTASEGTLFNVAQ